MAVSSERVGNVLVLEVLLDAVDVSSSERMRDAVRPHLAGAAQVVLDLARVEFLDSQGLAELLTLVRHLEGLDGALVVCGLRGDAKRTFELVRFDRVIRTFPDRAAALRFYGDAGLAG